MALGEARSSLRQKIKVCVWHSRLTAARWKLTPFAFRAARIPFF
jgi:hypothetical protein